MPQLSAGEVSVLTDNTDASACEAMYGHVLQRAQAAGGSLEGTTTVFYRAGAFYIAIVTTPEPAEVTPRPGYAHVRSGFTLVYVFDNGLRALGPVAL
jgi:hypothetical protein